MRILYFHQHFSTPQGATGIRSYEMAKRLIERGHQVTMVCGSYSGGNTGIDKPFIDGQRRDEVDGIQVIEFELDYSNAQSFTQRTLSFLKFAYRSVKLALTHQYDLVFSTTTPLTAAIPGIFARWFKGKPFVFEVRDLWPELPKAMGVIKNPIILAGLGALEWLAYKSAHGHIGLSPGIVSGIEKTLKRPSKIASIPNGCDLDIFSTPVEPWQPNGINDNDFVAVFTGTHGQANGLDQVLAAAKILKEQNNQQIKIVLIGQGKLKPQLQQQAQESQLGNVLFLEPVDKKQLAKLMQRANVGLQVLANIPAFYYGTSPNKFFDYISAALPVLNNYPGWLAEKIVQNDCGVAIEPEKPTAFAQALISLSEQPEKCVYMGKNAQALAKSEFDRQLLSQQFVDYLEQVYQQHD